MRTLRVLMLSGLFLAGVVPGLFAATANDYAQAALKLYAAGDYAHAMPYFEAALKLDPKNLSALQGQAFTYYAQGQYQKAVEDCQRYLAIDPSNAKVATFAEQAKVKAAAAGRRGPAKTTVATTAPAKASASSPAPQTGVSQVAAAAPSQASTLDADTEEFKQGRIFLMKDFLKAYWKGKQKWPESQNDLATYLEGTSDYKNDSWQVWQFVNLTFTEMPNGSLSVKCAIKQGKETKQTIDAQFTMPAMK